MFEILKINGYGDHGWLLSSSNFNCWLSAVRAGVPENKPSRKAVNMEAMRPIEPGPGSLNNVVADTAIERFIGLEAWKIVYLLLRRSARRSSPPLHLTPVAVRTLLSHYLDRPN